MEEKILREVLDKPKQKSSQNFPKENLGGQKKLKSRDLLMEEQLISLVLAELSLFPKKDESFFEIINNLPIDIIKDQKLSQLAKQSVLCYNNFYQKNSDFNYSQFKKNLEPNTLKDYSDLLVFNVEKDFPKIEKKFLEKQIKQLTKELKRSLLLKKLKEVESELKEAENKKDKEGMKNFTQILNDLTQELFKLTS